MGLGSPSGPALGTAVAAALAGTPAAAATLAVGVGMPYASIGDAVTAAHAGDRIEVQPGTYDERPIRVTVDLEIVGIAGSVATLWRTDQPNQAVVRTNGKVNLTVEGFGLAPARDGNAVVVDGGIFVGRDLLVNGGNASALIAQNAEVTLENSVFDGNGTPTDGGHVSVSASVLTISGTDLVNGTAGRGGAIAAVAGSEVTVEYSVLDANFADEGGGAIFVEDSALTVDGSTITACVAEGGFGGAEGGAIWATGSGEVTLTASRFDGNTADGTGGAARIEGDMSLSVDATTFTANSGTYGGAIYTTSAGDVEIVGSTFVGNAATAGNGGALRTRAATAAPDVTILTSSFRGNTATDSGGAVATTTASGESDGAIVIDSCSFTSNRAATGGALNLASVSSIDAVHLLLCTNRADLDGGGARVAPGAGTQGNRWTNGVFTGNSADGAGGALFLDGAGPADVVNGTFLANDAGDAQGGAIRVDGGRATLVNDLIAFTSTGDGVIATDAAGSTIDWSAFWENGGGDFPASLDGAGIVLAEPALVSFSDDDDCGNDLVAPAEGSPLIDAGDPYLSDTDGTRSDIGATGGPSADPDSLADLDGDGTIGAIDCDDGDPDVHPGAEEVCNEIDDDCDGTVDLNAADPSTFWIDADGDGYGGLTEVVGCDPPRNGVTVSGDCNDQDAAVFPGQLEACDAQDQDCDGLVDEDSGTAWWPDQDGDGFGDASAEPRNDCDQPEVLAFEGNDCDDSDALVYPGAEDPFGDGVDGDCDGQDGVFAEEPLIPRGACGCAAAPPRVAVSLGWLAAGLLARRRRR